MHFSTTFLKIHFLLLCSTGMYAYTYYHQKIFLELFWIKIIIYHIASNTVLKLPTLNGSNFYTTCFCTFPFASFEPDI